MFDEASFASGPIVCHACGNARTPLRRWRQLRASQCSCRGSWGVVLKCACVRPWKPTPHHRAARLHASAFDGPPGDARVVAGHAPGSEGPGLLVSFVSGHGVLRRARCVAGPAPQSTRQTWLSHAPRKPMPCWMIHSAAPQGSTLIPHGDVRGTIRSLPPGRQPHELQDAGAQALLRSRWIPRCQNAAVERQCRLFGKTR